MRMMRAVHREPNTNTNTIETDAYACGIAVRRDTGLVGYNLRVGTRDNLLLIYFILLYYHHNLCTSISWHPRAKCQLLLQILR